MRLSKWGKLGLPALALAGVAGAVVVVACSSTNSTPKPGGGSDAGGLCTTPAPGTFPVDNCAVGDNSQCKTTADPGCPIDKAKCGDPATCLPMSSNAGKTKQDFRMRRLNVQAPTALASNFVQAAVVTKNIDLTVKACGDTGNGAFNWLLRVDTAANKLTTGGAPPSADPFGTGYCFYNHFAPPDNTTNVTPVTVNLTKNADGTYSGDKATILNVPIFLNGDINNVIILPIADATFHSFSVSTDGNCIGSFNQLALDSQCADDPTTCEKWKTAGSLGGYITLEAADTVNVADLSESLCVLLTSSSKGPDGKCKRDNGKIAYQGDYCSTSKQAGDCKDSFWLAATFAASAVKIDESGAVPECTAGMSDAGAPDSSGGDAGHDSSTGSDASTDATGE